MKPLELLAGALGALLAAAFAVVLIGVPGWLILHLPREVRRPVVLACFGAMSLWLAWSQGGFGEVRRKVVGVVRERAAFLLLHGAFVGTVAGAGWVVQATVAPERRDDVLESLAFAALMVAIPTYLVVLAVPNGPPWWRRVRSVLVLAPFAAEGVEAPAATDDRERSASG